jgi:DNA-binding LacI/PurR family transcriptional regulator
VANHLIELGHRVVAFAGGPTHSIDSKHRLIGLREGLANRNIELQPRADFFLWQLGGGRRCAIRANLLRARSRRDRRGSG